MDKSKHIFLQVIDLKDNNLTNVSSVSRGDDKISFSDSNISLETGAVTVKSDGTEVMKISKEEFSIETDNFDFTGNVSLSASDDSVLEFTEEGLNVNTPKIMIKDADNLQIISEDEDGNSCVKSDISESDTSKAKEIVVDDKVKIIVDNGTLCFIRKE